MSVLEAAFSHVPFPPAQECSTGTPSEVSGAGFDLRRLGGILREARESKGLTPSDVAEFLFVKKSTVCSIEAGDWGALPHPVYVKGYVKSYAAYLGVSGGIDDRLCPECGATPGEKREGDHGCVLRMSEDVKKGAVRRPPFLSLKKIAIICSSIAGLILGIAISPGLQAATPVSFKDVLTACHAVVTGLRRFILP